MHKRSVIKESLLIEYKMLHHTLTNFEETVDNYNLELDKYVEFTKAKYGRPPISYYSKTFIDDIYSDFVINKRPKIETIERLDKAFFKNKSKFSEGDILLNKFTFQRVILLRRHDVNLLQSCAWWVRTHPDGIEEFALPEDELKTIN
ncbi:hypothetical protein [Flavobacterium sp. J27]|uniref:hypothetical protein n=1 Tax=Flavobacterium sp. J27 TaxID=2060419 RepID=UPI00102F9924|nr:hypothetical protein [Flavobacterium sp. J27]